MKTTTIAALQVTLALLAWGLVKLFIFVKAQPGDLLDFSLFGVALGDSLVLTLCASGASACLAAVVGLFQSYGDRSSDLPEA